MADWNPLVNEIFVRAIESGSPAEGTAVLDRSCGAEAELRRKVEALLAAHDQAGTFLEHPAPGLTDARPGTSGAASTLTVEEAVEPAPAIAEDPATAARPIAEGPGSRIGPYKLLQSIGEGGMGVVYMAEQEAPIRRKVALKIIKPGMDTGQVVARFEAERQALALMDHPNIARVFDAGATDSGRPFFVMELVTGVPITEYCDQVRLTPRERLDLFVPVCQAIQHAHQKGIIHRDVKPSNVMVTIVDGRPTPKVIDFGIAKATGQRLTERSLFTQFGAVVGTLEYMSPEQAELSGSDVDTRSDVFSLGVLLYELLTGSTPLERDRLRQAGFAEILRRIRDEEPPRPSARLSDSGEALPSIAARRQTEPARLARLVRGELDWIVMKALEKDRARRYDSAGGFAHDVEPYLADEAVEACPPSRRYRLGKFVRRNRATLATVAAFAALLLAATAVSGYLALRARSAERLATSRLAEAERSRDQAKAVSQFMVEAFQKPNPHEDGRELKVVDLLGAAATRLDGQLAESPATRGALLNALGATYGGLGITDRAVEVSSRAYDALKAALGPDHPETLDSRDTLANAYLGAGRTAEALPLAEETLKLREARLGPDHPDTLRSRATLGIALWEAGRPSEAIALHEGTLKLGTARLGPDHVDTIGYQSNLAGAYVAVGRVAEGLAMHEEVLKRAGANYAPDHPNMVACRNNLAVAYFRAGRAAEAIPIQEEAVRLDTKRLGADHRTTLTNRGNLARIYLGAGRTADAIATLEDVLKLRTAKLGTDHPGTITDRNNLAMAYQQAGRAADAIALYEGTLKLDTGKLGPDQPEMLTARSNLAGEYVAAGRVAEGIATYQEVLKQQKAKLGPDHPDTLATRNNLAMAYLKAGRAAEAIPIQEEAFKIIAARFGPDHPETLLYRGNLAMTNVPAGRRAEGIAILEEVLKLQTAKIGADHPNTLATRATLGESYRLDGRVGDAIAMLEGALKDRTARSGADHPRTLDVRKCLGEAYRQAGRYPEAIALNEETLRLRTAKSGPEHPETIAIRNNLAVARSESGQGIGAIAQQEALVAKEVAARRPDDIALLVARGNLAESYRKVGRLAEAIAINEDVLKQATAAVGPGDTATLITRNNLAAAYQDAGRKDEAIALLREVVLAAAKIFGPAHPNTIKCTNRLGGLYESVGRWTDGESLYHESLVAFQAAQPDHWGTLQARSLRGACLAGMKKYDEAEPLIVSGYDGMKAREATIPPSDRPRLDEAAARVVRLYEAWGKPDKAEEWRRKTGASAPPAGQPRR